MRRTGKKLQKNIKIWVWGAGIWREGRKKRKRKKRENKKEKKEREREEREEKRSGWRVRCDYWRREKNMRRIQKNIKFWV